MAGISWKESLSRVYEDSNKYMRIDGSIKEQIGNLNEEELKTALDAYTKLTNLFSHSIYRDYRDYVEIKLKGQGEK
jgi:hypothetical protein